MVFRKKSFDFARSISNPEWESKTFSVNLTQDKIKNSPDIDTDKPVSRQHEELMRGYYSWPGYYGYGYGFETYGYWGLGMWGYPAVEDSVVEKEMNQMKASEHANENPHLRSTQEVEGYDIHATDGDIGEVEDFIIDDATWKIHFLVVDTGHWFPGKKVLISPDRIKEIDWGSRAVIIDTTIAQVKSSPDYDPTQELTEASMLILHDHSYSEVF
jgi:sporulation protein YlmC with PRC-barrel domain